MKKAPVVETNLEPQPAPGALQLMELEAQTLAEGQEWMRLRMEKKLAALAEKQGRFSPLGAEAGPGPQKGTAASNQLRRD